MIVVDTLSELYNFCVHALYNFVSLHEVQAHFARSIVSEVSTIEKESSVSPNSNQPTHHPNQYKQKTLQISRSYICTASSML
jgi:hypothetical protein